jgi:hypothetical protein
VPVAQLDRPRDCETNDSVKGDKTRKLGYEAFLAGTTIRLIRRGNIKIPRLKYLKLNGPVAQLDRVLDYESRCREFESLRVHHFKTKNLADFSKSLVFMDRKVSPL